MELRPKLSNFQKLSAAKILLLSFAFGMVVYLGAFFLKLETLTHIMLGWDASCLALISTHWYMFFHTGASQTHLKAKLQDETRTEIFAVVLVSTFAGLLAVILLLLDKNVKALDLTIALLGMFLSWFLVHTTFTMRYAHLYYGDRDTVDDTKKGGGLDFPGERAPDFIDFAYFSFVLGMTFQVSDVEISSRRLRRLALLHSMISFIFNTVIVALTINALAGMSK
ncbi:DUF1345 domain-containing protein [Pedobacter yonginense]|uniref:DUF1345 domain-containing protein n=1 Tax=Pedobacter yonginense TaxID=651869 RepID=A0A317ELN7_9SPHI|nr:DUF1345 domain-containing protein [Pedobacter yonginense]PWS27494.1 DUF1345 domain-containing protein [Pedobacter yonginense]